MLACVLNVCQLPRLTLGDLSLLHRPSTPFRRHKPAALVDELRVTYVLIIDVTETVNWIVDRFGSPCIQDRDSKSSEQAEMLNLRHISNCNLIARTLFSPTSCSTAFRHRRRHAI